MRIPVGVVERFTHDRELTPAAVNAQCFLIEPPAGHKMELESISSVMEPYTAFLVEARIGDRFIMSDSPVDMNFFTTPFHFRRDPPWTIYRDQPLELFGCTMGSPAVLPIFSATVVGTCIPVDMEEVAAAKARRLFDLPAFLKWLKTGPSPLDEQAMLEAMAAFRSGEEMPRLGFGEVVLVLEELCKLTNTSTWKEAVESVAAARHRRLDPDFGSALDRLREKVPVDDPGPIIGARLVKRKKYR